MDNTLILMKPDVYERGLQAEILEAIRQLPLTLEEHFQVRFTPEGIFELWPRIYGWRWTNSLMEDFPHHPLDAYVLTGDGAVPTVIEFKDALREQRSQVNSYRNMLHSPDDQAAFDREYRYLDSIRVA
ncbi:nucleoside-diphosphate kinase [Catenulispora pinisilvae]|uniref:nucleoside-diphosphate kinase n=1 Tax=Catenulispora pinisilvae TaxID=2705253 RepID=UPI002B276763|nr:nucleoside-diphosphate kinase [Catenulispora pinisilvae]